ncbi:hypothetical protein KEM60_01375 [Austwickia sp. TVS 96-490-7B]|uniref:AMIN-like domain-containing (lipo)protein n=1 Tax=Austwickia sp. TVS 96-490-7B TaxID=2830843 RepID=UPI001C577EAE|nr:hypothetical protein [Austwickia sp. TVS 96-490-7B]MBW3085178.1 hypothetical protein [Austwickia sp. TVS 96-490-7B]
MTTSHVRRTQWTAAGAYPRTARARWSLAGAMVVPLLLAGCGNSPTFQVASSGSASSPSAASVSNQSATSENTSGTGSPSGSATADCTFEGSMTVPGDTSLSKMTVTGVRVGQQQCADRFVVDLAGDSGKKPGYQVRYVPAVLMDGSGKPVALRGAAFLQVSVGSPSYDASGQPTYLPADKTEAATVNGYTSFKQVAWAGSFEGMTTFGIGVREKLPFTVQVVDDGGKTRLVVDVAHHPASS